MKLVCFYFLENIAILKIKVVFNMPLIVPQGKGNVYIVEYRIITKGEKRRDLKEIKTTSNFVILVNIV